MKSKIIFTILLLFSLFLVGKNKLDIKENNISSLKRFLEKEKLFQDNGEKSELNLNNARKISACDPECVLCDDGDCRKCNDGYETYGLIGDRICRKIETNFFKRSWQIIVSIVSVVGFAIILMIILCCCCCR